MTATEWLECTDPTPMLEFLNDKVSERKLRLFACACCRMVWTLIPLVFRDAIRLAEEHTDGRATDLALGGAVSAAHRARRKKNKLERAVYDATRSRGDAAGVARDIARGIAFGVAPNPGFTAFSSVVDGQVVTVEIPPDAERLAWRAAYASHLLLESSLLRCLVGNPLRPVSLDPAWLTPTVLNLAQSAYDERIMPSGELDSARLAVLSDALEEAGCDDEDILNHLRGPGPHLRGCWSVDLILGKE